MPSDNARMCDEARRQTEYHSRASMLLEVESGGAEATRGQYGPRGLLEDCECESEQLLV